jgi:hypothetical protein
MRRHGPGRRWLPAIAVLAVLTVTTLGGFVAAGALSEPAGRPVAIPGVVSVRPLTGWEPAPPGTVAGRPFVRLTRGSGTLAAVAWGPFAADATALAVEVRDQLLDDLLGQLTVSEVLTPVVFDQGLPGQRFTFVGIDVESGVAVEGEVTTTVSADGQGVAFVGLAHEGMLAFIAGDLHTMVAAARLGVSA